ncbi:cobalamin biosynthesis protein CobQ [Roseobacter sp. YSTF-M11]|uniref:Cobalamin biosynthesis protein CobQ n=1 Tax=Roseobacter insulae TaxID=2859783 RepID=A0A9X1FV53_9RHOB|nr:cobalamin biosynthesis protein CobQ [Roseobacter insulae]MBW4707695.1 cobalamin biosynthesis protein CobQ [Roseobacter insulae]
MNTPAHLLIGAAALGHKGDAALVWAAMVGALLPDLSLYLLAGGALYLFDIAPSIVFNELYFSTTWQIVFAIDNSIVLWGLLVGVAIWRRVPWAIALTGAALLHLLLDFPLHHDDGRAHFWPLTGWVFESPVSYWDRDHGAMWIAPLEAFVAVGAAMLLWKRQFGWRVLVPVGVLVMAELWVVRQWLFIFVDS